MTNAWSCGLRRHGSGAGGARTVVGVGAGSSGVDGGGASSRHLIMGDGAGGTLGGSMARLVTARPVTGAATLQAATPHDAGHIKREDILRAILMICDGSGL